MAGFDRLRERTSQLTDKLGFWVLISVASLPIIFIIGYVAYAAYLSIANGDKDSGEFIGKLIGVVVVGVLLNLMRGALSSGQSKKHVPTNTSGEARPPAPPPKPPPTSSIIWIEAQLEYLNETMFGDRRPPHNPAFLQTFPSSLLNEWYDEYGLPISALESAIRALVHGTRSRIGSLDVPLRNVKVEYSSSARLPGNEPAHIEFGTWTSTIRIDTAFRDDPFGMCSILCHELAHFVMDQNSLRNANKHENEKLTDLFVFACGQGRISLGGIFCYKGEERGKLGYLSIEEMAWAFVRSACHRGLNRDAIIAACLDRDIERVVQGVLEFLTIKDGTTTVLADVVVCPSKHILRFNPSRRSVKCPKCGWQSEMWNRREDQRANLIDKGQRAFGTGDFEEALRILREAQTLVPLHSLSYCLAAECLTKLGRRQDAVREVRKILTISPNDEVAQSAMKSILYN